MNPEIKNQYLEVGNGHSIYYESFGNSQGKNILFLHGGPGGSFSESDKRFFDPSTFNVAMFDQRGTGKSTPLRDIRNNTTQDILGDITRLLDHLEIENTILFGGSWGSTLALLYAIGNPNRVSSLYLRGIFTASKRNRELLEKGGIQLFYPKVWNRFSNKIPINERDGVTDYYFKKILSSKGKERKKLAYELIRYGLSLSRVGMKEREIENILVSTDYITKAIIQSHYALNNFFLPDNFIMNNLEKIGSTPVSIVQGRYDMICPPQFAIEVSEKLKNSKLFLVDAGHSSNEPNIESKLISLLEELKV